MRHPLFLTVVLVSQAAGAQSDRPADILALRQLLVAHEFVRLDSALSARRLDARRSPALEARYVHAYDAFAVADTTLRPHLDAWIAQQPASPHPPLARGELFIELARRARGGGWASDTKEEQFARMRDWLRLAVADASVAVRLDSTDVMAHAIVMNAARLDGSAEARQRVVDQALALERASLALRAQHMMSLRPRWGGSEEEMDAFAEAAQQHVAENPRLRVLLGFSAWDRGEGLWEDDQYQAAAVEYTKALSYGDFWRFRLARGWVYVTMHRPEQGLVDLNRAIAERPGIAEALAKRAITYDILAYPKEGPEREALMGRGLDDLAMATSLDPADPFVVWTRKNYPELIRPSR